MAIQIKRVTGARFLFDIRGFMAEEYADAGLWKAHGTLFRMVKRVERRLVSLADAIVVLTGKSHTLLHEWYGREVGGKTIEVIPCCVDMRVWKNVGACRPHQFGAGRPNARPFVFVYVGKLGGWYLTEAMTEFVAAAKDRLGSLRWQVWTQSNPSVLEPFVRGRGLESEVAISSAPPGDLPAGVGTGDAGLAFMTSCFYRSPTKIGEYLAAGLPVVASRGVGDVDELLIRSRVGVVVSELTTTGYLKAVEELLALVDDPGTAGRCRAVAREYLDLEGVGWARYRKLYREVLG
jgi:glycosyltransferase involved in cell wall biosynthesis